VLPKHRPFLEDKLLRLRKGVKSSTYTGDNIIPPLMPTEQVFDYYDQKIRPLFGKNQLVEQIKVAISPSLIASCNEVLNVLESHCRRPDKRVGWHLTDDEVGLLVTSMASTPSILKRVEFKPKWLAQSPTAPPESVRCRTCALLAFRNKKPQVCPLRLTALNTMPPKSTPNFTPPPWVETSLESREPAAVSDAISFFFSKGKGHDILKTLKEQQLLLDPKGVSTLCQSTATQSSGDFVQGTAQPRHETTEEEIAKLSMAMTLRDCSFFANASYNDKGEIVIDGRLADLDPKSGDDAKRLGKWYWDEICLVEQGWYTGIGNGAEVDEREEECWLWKGEPRSSRLRVGR
jgi:inositol-pentakisphosphate 2-kinase